MVISNESDLSYYESSGDKLDAKLSTRLLESIFFKNSPLHDGAVLIQQDTIKAARCVLPVTENDAFPAHLGMRHRSAVGITEVSDSIAIIVSEESGSVSYAKSGKLRQNLTEEELYKLLKKDFRKA
jgi:DNA integrity scanning protein DisA with diadenylate cyclase activity